MRAHGAEEVKKKKPYSGKGEAAYILTILYYKLFLYLIGIPGL
jgi:hypothetical protein